ncbi:MAG: hypothetical protein V4638_04860 [Bacteroidota bacterium]
MLEITRLFPLTEVPSASGIEKVGENFWLIGDNSPNIFWCDEHFTTFQKAQLYDYDDLENGVIPKKKKRDLEAMFSIEMDGDSHIFIFGSGSKEKRMKGFFFSVNDSNKIQQFDLENLYHLLMKEGNLSSDELNIEAAAVLKEEVYFFNRKRNCVFSMSIEDFLNYVSDDKNLPTIKSVRFKLPSLDGFEAGFSGAATDEINQRIIFTASVEQTDSTYFDGETSGSFVGFLTCEDLAHGGTIACEPLSKNRAILKVKVESICIHQQTSEEVTCFLVTDSDGGVSELIEIKLK